MNKFITVLAAIALSIVFTSTSALAQELVSEDPTVQEQAPPPVEEVPITEPTDSGFATCGPSETLSLVPQPDGSTDVFNADGALCARIAPEATPQPAEQPAVQATPAVPAQPAASQPVQSTPPRELPRTGSGTAVLAVGALLCLAVGCELTIKADYLRHLHAAH